MFLDSRAAQPRTQVLAIGTALPRYQASQEEVATFMKAVAGGMQAAGLAAADPLPQVHGRIDRLARHSAIQRRASVLPDFTAQPEAFTLFPRNWALEPPPSTAQRMEVYRREAPLLAAAAAERCLEQAPAEARRQVTHLILVSCTGFFAPGVDVDVVRALGLRDDVQRQLIGFMGCYAAITGLRAADAICQADPEALVLLLCVELCSLHFQRSLAADAVVSNCLFSDGAAAALLGRRGPGRLRLLGSASQLTEPGSSAQMTWSITDAGFRMTLAAAVPETLRQAVTPYVDGLLAQRGRARREVAFWAIHPGGRRIVEVLSAHLGLPAESVAPSYEVLAAYGNMSSATLLFVLQRWLQRPLPPAALGVAMAFGPGLALEGMLLETPEQARA